MKPSPSLLASLAVFALGAALGAAPARADELFGGVYAHDFSIIAANHFERGTQPERGDDVELGWRGTSILPALGGPQPHLLVSLNSAGATHFAAAGLSWRIGRTLYARPGIGIAVHSGPDHWTPTRIWLGSRFLFEPEIGVGVRLSPRASVEASWVHLSHAQLFGGQNPGLDMVGLRLNYRFR
jgi:lipid A 3-O-deacylase